MDIGLLSQLEKLTPQERYNSQEGNPEEKPEGTGMEGAGSVELGSLAVKKGRLIDVQKHPRFAPFPRHHHSFIEIIYMCSGESVHIINEKHKIILKRGELLFLGKEVSHEIEYTGEHDIMVNIMILPEFLNHPLFMLEEDPMLRNFLLGAMDEEIRITDYLHFHVSEILPIQNLVENMIWCITRNQHNHQRILRASLGTLFLHLMNHTDKINLKNPDQYEESIAFTVIKYIEDNYRKASLEEFAQMVRQPTYYVSKLIKKQFNRTFKQLVQQKRLSQAAYCLIYTNMVVEQIIERVGYDNSSYFHKIFREYYGMTPKKFRNFHKTKNTGEPCGKREKTGWENMEDFL